VHGLNTVSFAVSHKFGAITSETAARPVGYRLRGPIQDVNGVIDVAAAARDWYVAALPGHEPLRNILDRFPADSRRPIVDRKRARLGVERGDA
jgi:hypothetical protein